MGDAPGQFTGLLRGCASCRPSLAHFHLARLAEHHLPRVRLAQTDLRIWQRAVDPKLQPALLFGQPIGMFSTLLLSGFLVKEIGLLAMSCRFFGGRRLAAFQGQRPGLSFCEAIIRSACSRLDNDDPHAGQTLLCRSAGRQLLSMTDQPDAPRYEQ